MKNKKTKRNIHPGEILLSEFLEPLGVSRYRLDKEVRPLTRAA